MSEALLTTLFSTHEGAWLDASPVSRFKLSGTALVSYSATSVFDQWVDRSGYTHDATQSNAAYQGTAETDGTYQYGNLGGGFDSNGGGGNTTAFYFCAAVDCAVYYGTFFGDRSGSNGVYIFHDGDTDALKVTAGATTVSKTGVNGSLFTNFGKHLVEGWWDGTDLVVRVDKGTPATTAKSGSITAGSSSFTLGALVAGSTQTDQAIGKYYHVVYFKNYCPSSGDRDTIAAFVAGKAGISVPGAGTSGTMAATEASDAFYAWANSPMAGHAWASAFGVHDTFSSVASSTRSGALAATEAADTAAVAADLIVKGTLAASEALDTMSSDSGVRSGSMAAVETASDGFFAYSPVSSDTAFATWLQSTDRMPVLLIEAGAKSGGSEVTRYLSNTGYTTSGADTPANTHYLGVINDGGKITERLSLTGEAAMAFGDVEVSNPNGDLDAWLSDIWNGRTCKMYVGDQRWARSDFRLIFDGITAALTSRARDVLNLSMRDKLQRLNTTVSTTKLGGTSANADRLIPLTFGECHNVTPLLIDKSTLTYQVHGTVSERLIETRDNGVVVSTTGTFTTDGKFSLAANPAGTVTCSVQGDKTGSYANTVAALVQRIAKGYGTDPLVDADLDLSALAAFDAAHPQSVGLYLVDKENVLGVCQALAKSVGAQLVMPATGKLKLIQISLPAIGVPTAVSSVNMRDGSLSISDRPAVSAAVKLNYAKNWTVQTSLTTGIPAEHKDLYAQEWLTATATDSTTATDYKLTTDPDPEDTYLLVTTDAQNEANRRLTLRKTQRTVFRYEGLPELMMEQLGGYQTVTDTRFELDAGGTGQIISIERDWLNSRVAFEVLV